MLFILGFFLPFFAFSKSTMLFYNTVLQLGRFACSQKPACVSIHNQHCGMNATGWSILWEKNINTSTDAQSLGSHTATIAINE